MALCRGANVSGGLRRGERGWLGHNCGAVSAFLCGMAQALDIWFGVWQKHLSGRLAELEAGCFSLGSASNPSDG